MPQKQPLIVFTFGIFLFIVLCNCCCSATEYPAPPPIPKAFDNPDDLQKYLNKLHNYYVVVGRPRFGKRNYNENAALLTALLKHKKQPYFQAYEAVFSSEESDEYPFSNDHKSLIHLLARRR